jgi:hypothetical protein
MAALIYALCAITASAGCWLILRSYFKSRHRILLWTGLCFAGMSANNLLLVVDRLIVPAVDLLTVRLITALAALLILLFGLVWEEE